MHIHRESVAYIASLGNQPWSVCGFSKIIVLAITCRRKRQIYIIFQCTLIPMYPVGY